MVFSFGLCFANSTTLMNKHQFDVPWWRFEYKWTRLSQILWSFPCDFLLLLDSWLRDRSTPPFPIVQHTFIRSHYWFYHTWLILLSFHSPLPSFLDLYSKTLLAWHVWKINIWKTIQNICFKLAPNWIRWFTNKTWASLGGWSFVCDLATKHVIIVGIQKTLARFTQKSLWRDCIKRKIIVKRNYIKHHKKTNTYGTSKANLRNYFLGCFLGGRTLPITLSILFKTWGVGTAFPDS